MKKIWYGKWKWLKRVVVIGFLLGIVGILVILGINQYIKVTAGERIGKKVSKVDCILVLGAGLTKEGTPSLVLRDRLNKGIELYKEGVSDRLLMSGDHGRDGYDEVKAMKQYAVDAGVDSEDIFMDHAGFSTYESIYRARDVFQVKSLAIVTQPYHEYRAVYIAMKLGLDVYGTPSKATQYRGSWMLEAREKLARTKEFFNVIWQPKPTYLGKVIPIRGSGSQTDDTEQTWKPTVISDKAEDAVSVEQQIRLIAQSEKTWRLEYREKEEPNYYQGSGKYWYMVTDLDHNGRLELISAATNGTGGEFGNECYEVSQMGDRLEKVNIEPELDLNTQLAVYRDDKSGSTHYEICDSDRGGAIYYTNRYQDVVKKGKNITSTVYASHEVEGEKETYFEGDLASDSGEDDFKEKKCSKKEFQKICENQFSGMEEEKGYFSWFQLAESEGTESGRSEDDPSAEERIQAVTEEERIQKLTESYQGFRILPGDKKQVETLISNQKLWLERESDLSPWDMKYAVTDLNRNGRLELIVTSGPIGSGGITYSWFYELAQDCQTLSACPVSSDEDDKYELAGPDLYEKKWTAYYDYDTDQYYYKIIETLSGGAGYATIDDVLLSMEEQKVKVKRIAGIYQKPSKKPPYVKKEYYLYGKDDTQTDTDYAGYKKAKKKAYKDYEKEKVIIHWIRIKEHDKDLASKLQKSCERFQFDY